MTLLLETFNLYYTSGINDYSKRVIAGLYTNEAYMNRDTRVWALFKDE